MERDFEWHNECALHSQPAEDLEAGNQAPSSAPRAVPIGAPQKKIWGKRQLVYERRNRGLHGAVCVQALSSS